MVLQIVENNLYSDNGDTIVQDPECMALLFQFLHSIVKLNMQKFVSLYPVLVKLAIHWVQNDIVCSEALAILTSIAWYAKDHYVSTLQNHNLHSKETFIRNNLCKGENANIFLLINTTKKAPNQQKLHIQ